MMTSGVQPKEFSAADLAAGDQAPVSGPVRLSGWLVFKAGAERGWLAASEDDLEPVVYFAQSAEILDVLGSSVSMLLGGDYQYINWASLTGSLKNHDAEYVVSDVDEIEVSQVTYLSLKPVKPLKKKTDL